MRHNGYLSLFFFQGYSPLPLASYVSYVLSINSLIMNRLIVNCDPVFISRDRSLLDFNILATMYCIDCYLLSLIGPSTISS